MYNSQVLTQRGNLINEIILIAKKIVLRLEVLGLQIATPSLFNAGSK